MSYLKQWKVGLRTVGLMSDGAVIIIDESIRQQYTLALSSIGMKALRDILTEVLKEIENVKTARHARIALYENPEKPFSEDE